MSYYGEQKIERLMNEKADNVQVRSDFIDQDGKAHCLVRFRNGDKGTMTYDGYTIKTAALSSCSAIRIPLSLCSIQLTLLRIWVMMAGI